jgi:hypothetical protein
MSFALGETVTLHRRPVGTPNSDGNDTYTDTDTTISGVAVYPRESTELVQGGDLNIVGLVAVFVPAITVAATDELTVRGTRWAIDGDPGQYVSPLTGKSLTKVNLTRVTG